MTSNAKPPVEIPVVTEEMINNLNEQRETIWNLIATQANHIDKVLTNGPTERDDYAVAIKCMEIVRNEIIVRHAIKLYEAARALRDEASL